MAHFLMSYGRCTIPGSPMGWSETLDRLGASMKKHQENYFSGREIQMTSMPRQRGVTEFQPKRALSNSNPNG